MDSALPHLTESGETLIGLLVDSRFFQAGRYSFTSLTTDFKWRFDHPPSVSSSSTPTRVEFQATHALIEHNFTASCLLGVASEAPMMPQAARGIALAPPLKDPASA